MGKNIKAGEAIPSPDLHNINIIAVTGGLTEYIDILAPTVETAAQILAQNSQRRVLGSMALTSRWGVGLLPFSLPAEFRGASSAGVADGLPHIEVPELVSENFAKLTEADAILVIWLDNYRVERNFFRIISKHITVYAGLFDAKSGKLIWHMSSEAVVQASPLPVWPDSIASYSKPGIIYENDPLALKAAEMVSRGVLQ